MRGIQALTLLLLTTAAHAQLSLFSIVTFKNLECQATTGESGGAYSGLMGTCLSSTECSDQGGSVKGNCAAGFGVCCLQQLIACGGTVTYNNTYISSVGFPTALTAATATTTCTYTIKRLSTDICQIRLDFEEFVLNAGTAGETDATAGGRMVVDGGSGFNPPTVTGTLTGDHMYIEVYNKDPTITITQLATQSNQIYNIQTAQIECDSAEKAPRDCTQWFTTDTGVIRSYNTRGTTLQELTDQNMNICIRQNKGFCGAIFNAVNFEVGSATAMAGNSQQQCAAAQGVLSISGPDGIALCQGVFAGMPTTVVTTGVATSNAPITVKPGPLRLNHLTTGTGVANADGFVINYSQI